MKQRWKFIFNLLVVYIFLQFAWWSVLIARQLHSIYGDSSTYYSKLMMILGEGMVFLGILITGIYFVRKSIKREMEINRQQRNFLLAVTHELKTPIAVSKLSLQTIANRQLDPEKQKEIIQKALSETDRLNELVENILLGVKLEEKQIALNPQPAFLLDILSLHTETLKNTIGKNHHLQIEIPSDLVAKIDQRYFLSVISNLYENAVKYTPQGCTIGISAKQINDKVEILFWDNGPGIPDNEINLVFNRFFRGGNEDTRTAKGTGLGLFITKQLIEMHGGKISCRKHLPNGTEFQILLNR